VIDEERLLANSTGPGASHSARKAEQVHAAAFQARRY